MIRRSTRSTPLTNATLSRSILNTASNWGLVGGERGAAYCASKGAVVILTKAMALDHARQNLRLNSPWTGDTDTPMLRIEAAVLGDPARRFLKAPRYVALPPR